MAENLVSLSSNRDDREIDEYYDNSRDSSSSSSTSSGHSKSTDKQSFFGVPRIPLKVF